MAETILITGGCGFVGHHFVEHFIKNSDFNIIVVDCLTYAASGFDRLRDIEVFDDRRVKVLTWDLRMSCEPGILKEIKHADYIIHIAAESHVDRSIADPIPFINSNVLGTQNLLLAARLMDNLKLFINFSSDEIFGPAPYGVYHKEYDRFNTTNPYAATKAAALCLCEAEYHTHKTPIINTITMNIFGERQHPEKFLVKCIKAAFNGGVITIHADPTKTISGSRCWIHARNVAAAVSFIMDNYVLGDRYNIVGEEQLNYDMAKSIVDIVSMTTGVKKMVSYEFVDFHPSRPGYDMRYALNGDKLKGMGWEHPKNIWESLEKMVRWSVQKDNIRWLGM